MKKRYIIAGSFIALSAISSLFPDENIAKCNDGNLTACEEVSLLDHKHITNPEWLAAKEQADKEAFQADVNKRVKKGLIKRCENELKWSLKDPDSYKRVSANVLDWGNEKSVTINYSATNSFGGRVRNQEICRYVTSA